MGYRLSKTFFHFVRTNFALIWHICCDMTFCYNMWHIAAICDINAICDILQRYIACCNNMWHIAAICHILLQHAIYRCNMSHIALICHILLQYVTYWCSMWHIAAICDILQRYVTYCSNMSLIFWDMTNCSNMWHIYRMWEQLAPLGCFLFADLFRYRNDVMCVESPKHKDIFAPFLLVYYYYCYYWFISHTSDKYKQHKARSIVNNKHTHKKRISINNGQQCSLASLGYADMASKELRLCRYER